MRGEKWKSDNPKMWNLKLEIRENPGRKIERKIKKQKSEKI